MYNPEYACEVVRLSKLNNTPKMHIMPPPLIFACGVAIHYSRSIYSPFEKIKEVYIPSSCFA